MKSHFLPGGKRKSRMIGVRYKFFMSLSRARHGFSTILVILVNLSFGKQIYPTKQEKEKKNAYGMAC